MALPRGFRNNNPLNIVKGNNWQGEVDNPTDSRFEQFVSMEYGVRAGFKILQSYMNPRREQFKPANSLSKIVRRWAPPSENLTDVYVRFVSQKTGIDPDERISYFDRRVMVAIVDAMIKFECGQSVEIGIIESAYDLAGTPQWAKEGYSV